MKEYTLNMLSRAESVKGQGVLSAYEEELELVTGRLGQLRVLVNSKSVGDVTHIHTVNPEFFVQIPFLKMRSVVVGSVHFLPETVDQSLKLPEAFRKTFYGYLIQFYKSMDHLVTVNPSFIPKIEAYGIDSSRVTYIPNYVSGSRFFPADRQEKRELRVHYGLDPDRFTVVCAGQLQTRKGVSDYAALAAQRPQMQFVWAGDFSFGSISDGHREIEQLLKQHPDNLHFPGLIEREKMPQIYRMGDVMLLPSYDELFPMTVLEAMSCGIPVLLRNLDLYRVILDGYYLAASDNREFLNQLDRLKTEPDYYAQAMAKAKRGNDFYGQEHVLSMWRRFYQQMLEESVHRQEG